MSDNGDNPKHTDDEVCDELKLPKAVRDNSSQDDLAKKAQKIAAFLDKFEFVSKPQTVKSPVESTFQTENTNDEFMSLFKQNSNLKSLKKNLVDKIQEDFPRTPSPVHAQFNRQRSIPSLLGNIDEGDIDKSTQRKPSKMDNQESKNSPFLKLEHAKWKNDLTFKDVGPINRAVSTPVFINNMIKNQTNVNKLSSQLGNINLLNNKVWSNNEQLNVNNGWSKHSASNIWAPNNENVLGNETNKNTNFIPKGMPQRAHTPFGPFSGIGQHVEFDNPARAQSVNENKFNNKVFSPYHPQFQQQPLYNSTHYLYQGAPDTTLTTRMFLLEEFRHNKSKKYELKSILGNMVEFSIDQHGSRFIQQKLETATEEEKIMVFEEILPRIHYLISDVFGNYVIQKFFEFGTSAQRLTMSKAMEGNILYLSLQMYGCRVVQKAIEFSVTHQKHIIVKELEGNVIRCVKDQNGNHVIQKAIECVEADRITFIIEAFKGVAFELATHPYGCRVIQRMFEHCSIELTRPLLEELNDHVDTLVKDQYGNYVIQHVLERGQQKDREFVFGKILGNVLTLSKHKFASNVVEKCVAFSSENERILLIKEVLEMRDDGSYALTHMMRDQFANYVVQKMLDTVNKKQCELLILKMWPHMNTLRKYAYGKHLINKVEKIIAQYEARNPEYFKNFMLKTLRLEKEIVNPNV